MSARSSIDRKSSMRTSRYDASQLETHQLRQCSARSAAAGINTVGPIARMSCFILPSCRVASTTRSAGAVVDSARQETPSRFATSFASTSSSSSSSFVGPCTRIKTFLSAVLPTPMRSHPARLTAKYPLPRSGRSSRMKRSKASMFSTTDFDAAAGIGSI